MDLERSVRQILDREAVTALVHDYCRLFDENRPQDVAALFTDDAVVDYGPESDTIVGRDAIGTTIAVGLSRTFAATSHHVSNVQVVLEDDERARSTSYLYAWHRYVDGSPDGELWGRYRHRFVRTEGAGWRIAELRLEAAGTVDFHRATMHPVGRRTATG
jgi:ketosteroid isomerase-like protein